MSRNGYSFAELGSKVQRRSLGSGRIVHAGSVPGVSGDMSLTVLRTIRCEGL